MFNNCNILKLFDRIKIANCLLISNYVHNKLPSIFNNWFTFSSCFYQYETPFATKGHFKVPSVKRTSYGKGTITIMVVKTWDDIEKKTKDVLLNSFSPTKLKLFLNKFFFHIFTKTHPNFSLLRIMSLYFLDL